MNRWIQMSCRVSSLVPVVMLASCMGGAGEKKPDSATATVAAVVPGSPEQIAKGRFSVITHDCGGCHGGSSDPAAPGFLDGMRDSTFQQFIIGPFKTRARNLTPDNSTGLGRFSERQIFNALRFGLRPGDTPDVEITSTTPGQGNFPTTPHYLAPPMPWPAWRQLPDDELWAIAAYLKHGLKPVNHKVADSDGPPDFWASAYTDALIGKNPSAPFPTANEMAAPAKP